MDINITLVIQMLVFAVFVWFTMTFVWPPLAKALEERQQKIADGLAAAERGHKELELAQHRVKQELVHAKEESKKIIQRAYDEAAKMVDEARENAKIEAQRQVKLASDMIQQEVNNARKTLKNEVASVALQAAGKIIGREVNAAANEHIINELIEEM